MTVTTEPVLDVRGLKVAFRGLRQTLHAVNGVDLQIAAGELVVPFQRSLESAQAYYLVIPETPGPSAALLRFAAWLQEEAAAYREGAPAAGGALPIGAAARDGHA